MKKILLLGTAPASMNLAPFGDDSWEIWSCSPGTYIVPNCKVLDWEGLVNRWGPYNFTSSLAWMLAMAIEEKPDKIAMYGVDMGSSTEYYDQRMGCVHFAVEAVKRGIEVGVPPESDLFRPPPLYGVCEQSHAWIKQTARARELAGRVNAAQEVVREKSEEIHFLRGAMDDQDWQLHSWFGAVDMLSSDFVSPVLGLADREEHGKPRRFGGLKIGDK